MRIEVKKNEVAKEGKPKAIYGVWRIGFIVASGGVLSEGYGHVGPGVCLGDGQTETERVSSQG